MAGDDYDPENWPLVVWAAHHAVNQLGVPLHVTEKVSDDPYNRFPSWYFVKPQAGPDRLEVADALAAIADAEKARVAELRRQKRAERRAGGGRGCLRRNRARKSRISGLEFSENSGRGRQR